MLLTIDVGNTQIYVGVFDGDDIKASFRRASSGAVTSDELGVFILQALHANAIAARDIKDIAISSVVPALTRSIVNCAVKYFNVKPFVAGPGVKTSVKVPKGHVNGLGADRVCDIEAAMALQPGKNLIIMDFGTANTFCAVSKTGVYLGGAIAAGIGMSMNALANGAALLSNVEIKNPGRAAGMTTAAQLQAGLFYSGLGAAKEICARLARECFKGQKYISVGTGGFGRLYESEGIFDVYAPDLVLTGLKALAAKNAKGKKRR
ncbi:MAG: type III pantothenate kinase [Elusimicrobiota bacterium]|jgi:type III pantothenate kinase|nr:type III pantothenate kinase [Elusimicrobiota bacterium]